MQMLFPYIILLCCVATTLFCFYLLRSAFGGFTAITDSGPEKVEAGVTASKFIRQNNCSGVTRTSSREFELKRGRYKYRTKGWCCCKRTWIVVNDSGEGPAGSSAIGEEAKARTPVCDGPVDARQQDVGVRIGSPCPKQDETAPDPSAAGHRAIATEYQPQPRGPVPVDASREAPAGGLCGPDTSQDQSRRGRRSSEGNAETREPESCQFNSSEISERELRCVASHFGGCWFKIAPHVRLTLKHVVPSDTESIPMQDEMIAVWDDERAEDYDRKRPCMPVRGRSCHVVRMNREGNKAAAPGFIKNATEHTASTYKGCSGGAVYQATENFTAIEGACGLHKAGSPSDVVPNEFIGFNATDLATIAMLKTIPNKEAFLALAEKTVRGPRALKDEAYYVADNAEDRLMDRVFRDAERAEKLQQAKQEDQQRRQERQQRDERKHERSEPVTVVPVDNSKFARPGSMWLKVRYGYFGKTDQGGYGWLTIPGTPPLYAKRVEVGVKLGRLSCTAWTTTVAEEVSNKHTKREALEAMQVAVEELEDDDIWCTSAPFGVKLYTQFGVDPVLATDKLLEQLKEAVNKATSTAPEFSQPVRLESSDPNFPCDIEIKVKPKVESDFELAKRDCIRLDGDYVKVEADDAKAREYFRACIAERNKAKPIDADTLKSLQQTVAMMEPEFTPPNDTPLTDEEVIEYILSSPCKDGAAGPDFPRKSKASVLNNPVFRAELLKNVAKFERREYEGLPRLRKRDNGGWGVEYSAFAKPEYIKREKYNQRGGRMITTEPFWLTFVLMKHILRRYRYVTGQSLANGVAIGIVLRNGGLDRVLRRFKANLCEDALESDLTQMDINDRVEMMLTCLPLIAREGAGRDAAALVVGPKWVELTPGEFLRIDYGFFPSGSFITSFGQTVFKLAMSKNYYETNAMCVAYGDDGLDGIRKGFSLKPQRINEIRAHFRKFGQVVKLGLDDNGKPISIDAFWEGKGEFLSMRGTMHQGQRVIHCQRAEKIMANLLSSTPKTYPSNMLSAFVQLAFHPDKKWAVMIEKSRQAINQLHHFQQNPVDPLPNLMQVAAFWSGAETTVADLVETSSQLNGNNGEWTNEDDVKGEAPAPAAQIAERGRKELARLAYLRRMTKKNKSKLAAAEQKVEQKVEHALLAGATQKKKKQRKPKSRDANKQIAAISSVAGGNTFGIGRLKADPFLRGVYNRRARQARKGGTVSDAAILKEFANDSNMYRDSLLLPELHLPGKLRDGDMSPSVVTHADWEQTATTVVDAGLNPDLYIGFAINSSATKGNHYNLTNALNGAFTWSAALDGPNETALETDFQKMRTISRAAHAYDSESTLLKGGEWACARYMMAGQGWSGGANLPTTWNEFVASPNTETFPNTADCEGVRGTVIPLNPESGGGTYANTGTAQNSGGWFVVILKVKYAATNMPAPQVVFRVYENLEAVPFQDTLFLFEPTVDLGMPSQTAVAMAEVGGLMASLGSSMSSFASFLDSNDFRSLIARGVSVGRMVASLWSSGGAGLFAHLQRTNAFLRRTRESLGNAVYALHADDRDLVMAATVVEIQINKTLECLDELVGRCEEREVERRRGARMAVPDEDYVLAPGSVTRRHEGKSLNSSSPAPVQQACGPRNGPVATQVGAR